jgi:hypothetical protein
MTAQRTAAKSKTTKKVSRKSKTTKKAATKAKANGKGADTGPIEKDITEKLGKFKLKATQLEFERENIRVQASIQQQINNVVARAQRNDPAWKRVAEERKQAINEFIDKVTPTLPEGYAVTNVDSVEGTYKAIYAPERRGQKLD